MKTILAISSLCFVALAIQGCHKQSVAPPEPPEKFAESKAQVLEQSIAEGSKSLPTPSEVIDKSEVQSVDPVGNEPLDNAITCLARTIYWEARGENPASMEAIANVVMNRLGHEGFPNTVCGVVKQGHERGACQFSWWCDGRSDDAKEEDAYIVAKEIARKALNRQLVDRTAGALYFHQRNSNPSWSTQYLKTAEIGKFVFYKPHKGEAK
jgi:spore germination cell wall hydrolase CwlJ-like protein